MVTHAHVVGVDRNLQVRDAVGHRDSIAAAQQFRQHGRGTHLGRAEACVALPFLGAGFERHSQEALVQVEIPPVVIDPYRVPGVVGCVLLGHHAKHAAEPVNQIVISASAPDILQQRFADPLQSAVPLGLEGDLQAFGGMENDSRGYRTAHRAAAGGAIQR